MDLPADILIWRFSFETKEAGLTKGLDLGILSHEERERAGRFHFVEDARRYVHFHQRLRRLLASVIPQKASPASLKFTTGPYGKPSLTDFPTVHFNLSHSKNVGVLAVSRSGPLGIDVEIVDPEFPGRSIAEEYFRHEELAYMAASPSDFESSRRFYQLWTAKEAVMKLCGLGMNLPPLEIGIDFSTTPPGVDCRALQSPCSLISISHDVDERMEIISLTHRQPGAKVHLIQGDTPLASPTLLL